MAIKKAVPHAGNASQHNHTPARRKRVSVAPDSALLLLEATTGTSRMRHTRRPQNTAYKAIPQDQPFTCSIRVLQGSTTNGYATNANSEPTLDNAYSLYGEAPAWARANHACTSGPVEERIMYGTPKLSPSNLRIAHTGVPSPSGWSASLGVMGSVQIAIINKTPCTQACLRGGRKWFRQWA